MNDTFRKILLDILLEMGVGPAGTTLSEILPKIGADPEQRVFEGNHREYVLLEMGWAPGTALEEIRFSKSIFRYGDRCIETRPILVTWKLEPWIYRKDELEWNQCIRVLRKRCNLDGETADEDVLKGGKWSNLLAIYPGCPSS